MSDSHNEVVPLPAHLKREYVPSHQLTKNYARGMMAMEENRLEDTVAFLEAEPFDSPCRGLAIGNAGLALLRLEKFDLASKRLLEANDHFNTHGCPHPPSWVQFVRNHVESIAFSRPQEALHRFNCAVACGRELANKHENFRKDIELEIGHIFNSWGGTLLRLESPDVALDCFEEARDRYRKYESENKVGLAEVLTNISLSLTRIGKKNEASLALQEALVVAKFGGDKDQVRRIEIAMIQLDPGLINGDSLSLLNDAANEAIADGRLSTGYVRQCIRATEAEKLGDITIGLVACAEARKIEQRLDSGDPAPAKMRLLLARLLAESGSPVGEILGALFEGAKLWWGLLGKPQTTADLLAKDQSMHAHFCYLARTLIDEGRVDEACMAFESGRALGFGLEIDETALPKILKLAPFAASNNSVDCSGLRKVQLALSDSEAIISLAILPPDLVAFIVRKNSVEVVTLPLPNNNESQSLFDSIEGIARRLHKKEGLQAVPAVIQDFALKIRRKIGEDIIVSVIPNSVLHAVPWRALLRSLGLHWSQLPALTGFGLLVGDRKLSGIYKNAIALGNGTAGAIDLNQEAHDFAHAFGDRGSVVENATATDIQRALLKPNVVLISCHGKQRENLNRGTRHLYLSLDDGEKSVDEIWPDIVVAELVVLSACDSGVYEVAWGDFPIGAGPDLLRKGAKLCLATRFPVGARFAANLIQKFAMHLALGDSVQSALGQALNEMENSSADFWNEIACFELIG